MGPSTSSASQLRLRKFTGAGCHILPLDYGPSKCDRTGGRRGCHLFWQFCRPPPLPIHLSTWFRYTCQSDNALSSHSGQSSDSPWNNPVSRLTRCHRTQCGLVSFPPHISMLWQADTFQDVPMYSSPSQQDIVLGQDEGGRRESFFEKSGYKLWTLYNAGTMYIKSSLPSTAVVHLCRKRINHGWTRRKGWMSPGNPPSVFPTARAEAWADLRSRPAYKSIMSMTYWSCCMNQVDQFSSAGPSRVEWYMLVAVRGKLQESTYRARRCLGRAIAGI